MASTTVFGNVISFVCCIYYNGISCVRGNVNYYVRGIVNYYVHGIYCCPWGNGISYVRGIYYCSWQRPVHLLVNHCSWQRPVHAVRGSRGWTYLPRLWHTNLRALCALTLARKRPCARIRLELSSTCFIILTFFHFHRFLIKSYVSLRSG